MDRFFSKLDLRDIKIDPYTTSFPPDAEEAVEPAGAEEANRDHTGDKFAGFVDAAPTAEETAPAVNGGWDRPERRPHVPAWASVEPAPAVNGHAVHAAPVVALGVDLEVEVIDEVASVPDAAEEPTGGSGDVLKVSARSRPSAVAGAIAGVVREVGRAEVQAIGAGATNQAVKACAIARDYLRETGIEAVCLPAFIDVTIENEDRTAIRLVVEPR